MGNRPNDISTREPAQLNEPDMPPIQKRFPSQKVRKQKGKGRTYLILTALIAIIAIVVGVYVFELSGSAKNGDFTVSVGGPFGITIRTNQTTTSTITITASNGFRGTVRLTASAPTNVTATISPVNVTGAGTATLTMTATYPGNYTLKVTGSSGALEHSVTPVVATPVYATLSVTDGASNGTIEVELYRAQTPKTVRNFLNLAQSSFYSNLVWHRISTVNPYVIQTGDPNTRYGNTSRSTWGSGGSSQTVPRELDSSLHNTAGTLGMARQDDPNSGTSQFYINYADNTGLDGSYAVFGRVIKDNSNMVHSISIHPADSNQKPLDPLPFLVTVTISYTP